MERKQRFKTVEDDLALGGRNNGLFGLTNTAETSDGGSGWVDVDVDKLLKAFDVCPLGPVGGISNTPRELWAKRTPLFPSLFLPVSPYRL